jgi:hypothetical protein
VKAVLDGQVNGKSGKVEYLLIVGNLVVHVPAFCKLRTYGGRIIDEWRMDYHL